MSRIGIRQLVVGLFASCIAIAAFAQVPKPAAPAPQDSALTKATDRLELGLEKRLLKPVGPPQPSDIMVNCGLPAATVNSVNSINGALAKLDRTRVHTIRVSGACHENVIVQSFENLTLVANPGASINDASSGTLDTLDVADAHEFTLQGFTINGAVVCFDYSLCRFSGNTIQGSPGDGIAILRSQASLQGDTLQNNAGRGLSVLNGGIALAIGVTTKGNGLAGAIANAGGNLITLNVTSQNNGFAGLRAANHSTLRLIDNTVTGNGAQGVEVDSSSEARFDTFATGNVITGNAFAGVRLQDLSFGLFAGADNITGNNVANPGGFDVVCSPQFSATRGALTSIGGGTTNCVEP